MSHGLLQSSVTVFITCVQLQLQHWSINMLWSATRLTAYFIMPIQLNLLFNLYTTTRPFHYAASIRVHPTGWNSDNYAGARPFRGSDFRCGDDTQIYGFCQSSEVNQLSGQQSCYILVTIPLYHPISQYISTSRRGINEIPTATPMLSGSNYPMTIVRILHDLPGTSNYKIVAGTIGNAHTSARWHVSKTISTTRHKFYMTGKSTYSWYESRTC